MRSTVRVHTFDRLLVAQANAEPMRLLTADPLVGLYGEQVELILERAMNDFLYWFAAQPLIVKLIMTALPIWIVAGTVAWILGSDRSN